MSTEGPTGDKERHLRWMEMMWERHQSIAREEKRKEEILAIFEGIVEHSKRKVTPPASPPWEVWA